MGKGEGYRVGTENGDGFPVQRRGVTDYPGLSFVGMPWMDRQKSGLLLGVGEQAEVVASAIAGEATLAR
jgi:putative flavoprotein involved in K+ transport